MREITVLSLGAGVQSTFLYLAFMRGLLDLPKLDVAIFADTGDEPGAEARELGLPDTPGSVYAHLDWLRSLNGPPIISGTAGVLSHHLRYGGETSGGRVAAIPAFTLTGKSKGRTKRQCTREYKLDVIGKTLRREVLHLKPGRSPTGIVVNQFIGFSFDEAGRAMRLRRRKLAGYMRHHFPLVEKFITRAQIEVWLASQVPHEVPRSACVQCPFHSDDEWLRIKKVPLDWQRAIRVDETMRDPAAVVNRKATSTKYLHRSMQPLIQVTLKTADTAIERQGAINFAGECLGVCGM